MMDDKIFWAIEKMA